MTFFSRHRAAVVALLIGLVGVLGFIGLRATRPAPERITVSERVWTVQAHTLALANTPAQWVLYGRTETQDQVRVTAPLAGRLARLPVRDGLHVLAGAVLAEMDERDWAPRLAQARADHAREHTRHAHDRKALEEEKVLLALAEAQHERMARLHQARLGAHTALDQSREQLARARLMVQAREYAIAEHPARLQALKARLDEAVRDQERAHLRAPFEARVGKVQAAAGDHLALNAPILTLYPLGNMQVRARLPIVHTPELAQALAQGHTLNAEVRHAGRRTTAVLVGRAGLADARGEEVLLQLSDEQPLPVGAVVEVRLNRPLVEGALALPSSALHADTRVYRIRDNRLEAVQVTPLGESETPEGERFVHVAQGPLMPGDQIMRTHLPHALNGLAVQISPDS